MRTILFDVDGTLLDTEKIYMQAWREAGALHGYTVTEDALMRTRAVNVKLAAEIFRKYCGEDFDYDKVRVDRTEISERIIAESTPEVLLKPGAVEVLTLLKSQGRTIAAASSTSYQKTVDHLKHAGLLHFFDVIVGGDMVTCTKPDPEIFLKAAGLCGALPTDCVVVGDTPADVLAGSAAGMDVVLIPDQVPPNEQTTALSRVILNSLSQLPHWLAELEAAQ